MITLKEVLDERLAQKHDAIKRFNTFSAERLMVLGMLKDGKPYDQISTELGVPMGTVSDVRRVCDLAFGSIDNIPIGG